MRYIDTGRREPSDALGSLLAECSAEASSLVALRVQSGFFGGSALPFLASIVTAIATRGGLLRVLVGSNDGGTSRSDIEALLSLADPRRELLEIGVVSFGTGYFHPKTLHLAREDGSAIAYVGSANLTGHGVSSLHVEAGLLLDSRAGDNSSILADIADAVDWWFVEQPPGFSRVADAADLSVLSDAGILDRPRPQPVPRPLSDGSGSGMASLSPLVPPPAGLAPSIGGGKTKPAATSQPSPTPRALGETGPPQVTDEWAKSLSPSDAQRKPSGNQRGSVTLVQAGYPIDARTYFRKTFFGGAAWTEEVTRTNETRESTVIAFSCTVLGTSLGLLPVMVTFATNREAAQANYTSLLHLGPLSDQFAMNDLTGRRLELRKFSDGSFSLAIV